MKTVRLKTPVVYYGGKTAIIRHLLEMVPPHEIYTEVFFGGGTLFFAKEPVRNETINDKNDIVVNFYRCLKNNYKALFKMVDESLISRSIHRSANTAIRKYMRGEKVDKVRLAWAFWYSCNFNFGRSLGTGMSYSNDKTTNTADTLQNKKTEFTTHLVNRIQHAYIENNDFLKILQSRNTPKAFHYLDPPYFYGAMGEAADHKHYKKSFSLDDYVRLLEWCASECKGKFLLSNYDSELLDSYVKKYGWHKKQIVHRLSAPRKSGTAKIEILVSNYESVCQTLKLF